MSRTARSVNLTLTYLIITTMILSGIQVMLPALGLNWHEEYEELSNEKENQYISVSASDWNWNTIATTNVAANSNDKTSFILDDNDVAHVSYFDTGTNEIYYGNNSGIEWEFTLIDTALNVGLRDGMTSIGLGIDNLPRIAYIGGDFELKFASMNFDGSWSTETVITNWVDPLEDDLGISLAVDPTTDIAHICYYKTLAGSTLWYVNNDGGPANGWNSATEAAGQNAEHTKIQLDSDGSPRIAYDTGAWLKLATYNPDDPQNPAGNSADWDHEEIESGQIFNKHLDFVIDSNDINHIAWISGPSPSNNLMYWKTGESSNVILGGSVAFSPISIDVDSNDEPAIAIKETGTNELRLFYTTNQGSWGQSTIGDTTDKPFGYDANLKFDSENNPVAIVHNANELQLIATDLDGDDYYDTWDSCDNTYGESWRDRYGCLDQDYDGQSDLNDDFWQEITQWVDSDGDLLGDNWADGALNGTRSPNWPGQWVENAWLSDPSPLDWDQDGYEDDWLDDTVGPYDDCSYVYGYSTIDQVGCPDADQDGYSDSGDEFPGDPNEYIDTDGDGYGDNEDEFPNNVDEWEDSDGDGTGDNADDAPYDPQETSDSDGDGYGDSSDAFPFDDEEWEDSDGDGLGDNSDEFPYDSSETIDSDGDGYGDNSDAFPNDDQEWYDTDNDTYGDNMDWFPYDSSEWQDSDMDGVGDNSDAFPYDFTEYADSDNDTYGDNWDSCPYTAGNTSGWNGNFGCPDTDGDGWADSDDDFPNDATQNMDFDGDGYGENGSGNNPDACPGQAGTSTIVDDGAGEPVTGYGCPDNDNDGYANNIDNCPSISGTSTVDSYACPDDDDDGISNSNDPYPYNTTDNPEDWDNDGYLDHADNEDLNVDDFPEDSTQWEDSDGDGYGDNQAGNNADAFPNDSDEWEDTDSDGMGDNSDDCIYSAGNSSEDSQGCPDSDGDGWADSDDDFPNDATQNFDFDGDGYGENMSGNNPDSCPGQYGTSTLKVSGYMPSASGSSSPGGFPGGGGSPSYSAPDPGTNITWYGCPDEDSDSYEDNSDPCPFQYGNSWVDRFGCLDSDQDGISNLEDPYPNSATTDIEDWDGDGVIDHSSDVNLNLDVFPNDNTQTTDSDGDGYGDNQSGNNPDAFPQDTNEWSDSDGDGVGDNSDDCVNSAGNSTNFEQGCPDADGDGFADEFDSFPQDNTQWDDWDGDGYGDNFSGTNPDYCPNQAGTSTMKVSGYMPSSSGSSPPGGAPGGSPGGNSAPNPGTNMTWYGCLDSDSDNYEDNSDPCPYQYGNSWVDRYGCLDTDLDGISDSNDPYPNSAATDVNDWDGDGYPDHSSNNSENTDSFPNDNSQWSDSDLDGYGDNVNGTNPDAFPADPFEWGDSDGDGVGDNSDDCVNSAGNSTQFETGCPDTDGDGYANSNDDFPNDDTQWEDWDGDGYGDSFSGTTPDSCPNQAGTSTLKVFNGESETWYGCVDSDSDNYEDNTDQCPFQFGNSWVDRFACPDADGDGISDYNDPYPNSATPDVEDWDNDGHVDNSDNDSLNVDAFPYDNTQWSDSDGDGYGDNSGGNNPDAFPSDHFEWEDSDSDGYGDNSDDCVNSAGNSTQFETGCPDTDGDGYANSNDAFPQDDTQWEDWDGDGYGDSFSGTTPDSCPNQAGTSTMRVFSNSNQSWYGCVDSDSDNYEDNTDQCPFQFGNSWVDRFACLDTDLDGISDLNDPYLNIPTENVEDWDDDGYLDHSENETLNVDAFPNDYTQWEDADGDGMGDNVSGNNPDLFPNNPLEWSDSDSDGYGDHSDDCVNSAGNSTYFDIGCPDTDGDGYANLNDAFPQDDTQWNDNDGDGYGDSLSGTNPDACMFDFGTSTQRVMNGANESWFGCIDSDSDGFEDNTDPCPFQYGNSWVDRFGCSDQDQDGISDFNDPVPNVATMDTEDWDGDGHLDHAANSSNNADAFPNDDTQWSDSDSDGYGDNPNGNNPDLFVNISSQWEDFDNDGYGDNNQIGAFEPDSCPFDYGTSYQNQFGCADEDGDGWADIEDDFIRDETQWSDFDNDGYGDNPDGNDSDDCYTQGGTSTLTVNISSNTLESLHGCLDSDGDEIADTGDPCPFLFGNSWVDRYGCPDTDLDGISDLNDPNEFESTENYQDWDNDGYLDHAANSSNNVDAFPEDSTQWSDADGDGYGDNSKGNNGDAFPEDSTQWEDSDGDGFGDETNGNEPDNCPFEYGNSSIDRLGCIDTDGDGFSDESSGWRAHPYGYADSHPDDPTQWEDADGDGYGDNPQGFEYDAFPDDFYENIDTDGDGLGDNSDWCPRDAGTSDKDGVNGCPDSDGDGYADEIDAFKNEPTQWSDVDFDEHGDNPDGVNGDYFPFIPGQWEDLDGDGYGDNPTGPFADVFPNDSTQWTDYDGDNCGDNQDGNNPDRFPTDPTQCEDTDGDGYGDNPNGRDPDMFTDIYSQWSDIDGDGLGDNISEGASLADVCIDQETGNQKSCIYDRDNDGFDDLEDQFPDEPTQWIDADEDGKGDNPQGYNGDPYKNDRDNDGYQDPENEDSYLDEGEGGSCLIIPEEILFEDAGFEGGNVVKNQIYDEFPDSPSEWLDRDNDCLGDNLDADDDNDGSSDMEELVAGTNPYASGETPWGGVWIPGANVELGAWDLIGVLIGVPSVFYLGFAFITRDRRAMRYEEELLDCDDVVTLEQISEGYERALMMRLLGPHHGLMLERVRSRIEVQIETRGGRPRPADIVADAVKKKSKKTAPEIIEEDNNHED